MKHHLIKITDDRLHKPVITAVNRFERAMHTMRSDKIKICKKFVSIDKDFGRIKQMSSRVNKKKLSSHQQDPQ